MLNTFSLKLNPLDSHQTLTSLPCAVQVTWGTHVSESCRHPELPCQFSFPFPVFDSPSQNVHQQPGLGLGHIQRRCPGPLRRLPLNYSSIAVVSVGRTPVPLFPHHQSLLCFLWWLRVCLEICNFLRDGAPYNAAVKGQVFRKLLHDHVRQREKVRISIRKLIDQYQKIRYKRDHCAATFARIFFFTS